jgi:hypothetical protein
MKTKIGILTLLISLSIFWFGCSNRPISHQTEDLPITTPSMNFGTEEIAGEHRQSESNQRSLTPTITQTDTYTIFTSSALTHTLTGDVPISSETTIAMENLGRDIYLFDVKENMERKLFQDHFKATLIKWYKSGCRLVVGAEVVSR